MSLGIAGTAGADDASAGTLRCRASVAYVDAPGLARVEPMVANSARSRGCATDKTGLEDIKVGGDAGQAGSITIRGATARTGLRFSPRQATAEAGPAHVEIADASGKVAIGVDLLRSVQSGQCSGGAFAATGYSRVAGVSVNGHEITPDPVLRLIGDGLNGLPTGRVLRIAFDDVSDDGSASSADELVSRQAVHVVLRTLTGRTILEAGIGETQVGRFGDSCTPSPPARAAWLCRASVARVSVPGLAKLEPIVANSAGGGCHGDASGLAPITVRSPGVGSLSIDGASARTGVSPGTGAAAAQTAAASAGITSLELANDDHSFELKVDALDSSASGRCSAAGPSITGAGHVVSVSVNGREITPDGVFVLVGNGINGLPTNEILRITFDEHNAYTDPGAGLDLETWRAIHAEILRASSGRPLFDAVVGEAQVGQSLIDC